MLYAAVKTVRVGHHVAGGFMCRQPQQKSGSKQPRSNQHQHHAEAQEPQPSDLECYPTPTCVTKLFETRSVNIYTFTNVH